MNAASDWWYNLLFLAFALLVAALLFAATYMFEGIAKGAQTRSSKRRSLRWQWSVFRGHYPLGHGGGRGSYLYAMTFIWFARVFIVLWVAIVLFIVLR